MNDYFLGSVLPMAFSFAPYGSMSCEGQILAIQSNTALFALLGTYYGGNGTSTFALPDLRGRAVVGQGQGPGLDIYTMGEMVGTNQVSLLISNLPSHTHSVVVNAGSRDQTVNDPTNNYLGGGDQSMYSSNTPNAVLNAMSSTATSQGGSQPTSIANPYLAMYYVICTSGIFPSRN